MHARKWISNSPKIIEAIPTEERATEIMINSGQDPVIKTLGLVYRNHFSGFARLADNEAKHPT